VEKIPKKRLKRDKNVDINLSNEGPLHASFNYVYQC